MKHKIVSKVMGILSLSGLLLLVLAGPALAWWSGWYDAGFSGSYSPGTGSRYKHGQWDDSWAGGKEAFGSRMKWNSTRASGVRNYSNNRKWIWFCGWCYSYYTHDHTDMSNKLSAYGYATNFWSPYIDVDDDNGNGRYEEIEVVAVNSGFPSTDGEFYFYSYFTRKSSGSGTLYETPQISARNPVTGEYDTFHYDGHQNLGYYTYGLGQEGATEETIDLGAPYTITLNPNGQFPVHILGHENAPTMTVDLEHSTGDAQALTNYVQWARTYPLQELRKANVERALTVVTFRQPTAMSAVDTLLAATQGTVVGVKAVYVNENDPNPATRVWTVGIVDLEGKSYAGGLQELVADVSSNVSQDGGNMNLRPSGIVALTVWLTPDEVDLLNSNKAVYLADATPSYLRLVAAGTEKAAQSQASLEQVEPLPDGIPSFIQASYNDVYVEMQTFASSSLAAVGEQSK